MSRNLPEPADRLIRAFIATHRTAWSHGYLYNATQTLNRVHQWLAGRGLTLIDAEPADLSEYLAARSDAGLASSTVVGEHTRLRSFYRWAAIDPGDGLPYIARDPMRRVPPPKQSDPHPDAVPEVEQWQFDALMATCTGRRTRKGDRRALDRRDAAILAMLWHCGMRRGELVGINYGDVDWDSQMVHLTRTKGRTHARSRDLYIPDEAMAYVTRYVFERGEHEGALFESITRGGTFQRRPLQPNSIQLMLRRRCQVANETLTLPAPLSVSAHAFRRGFAAAWLDAGGQQVTLETHMGWKHDGRMAGRYTRRSSTALAAAEARKVSEARAASRRLRSVG